MLLVVPTAYAMLWYHFDGPGAKGNLYKGYMFSPYTVTLSVHRRPHPQRRQLVLFGPAGSEVQGLIADRIEEMRKQGASRGELTQSRKAMLVAYGRPGPAFEARARFKGLCMAFIDFDHWTRVGRTDAAAWTRQVLADNLP